MLSNNMRGHEPTPAALYFLPLAFSEPLHQLLIELSALQSTVDCRPVGDLRYQWA